MKKAILLLSLFIFSLCMLLLFGPEKRAQWSITYDKVLYEGRVYYIYDKYLEEYYLRMGYRNPFEDLYNNVTPAATWEIKDKTLYLKKIEIFESRGHGFSPVNIPLKKIFYDNVYRGEVAFKGIHGLLNLWFWNGQDIEELSVRLGEENESQYIFFKSDFKGALPELTEIQLQKTYDYMRNIDSKHKERYLKYKKYFEQWKKESDLPAADEFYKTLPGFRAISPDYEITQAELTSYKNSVSGLNLTLKYHKIPNAEIYWYIGVDEYYFRYYWQLPFINTVYDTTSDWKDLESFCENVLKELLEDPDKSSFKVNHGMMERIVLRIEP